MRKILFRGFHPSESGTTVITIDGYKVKGEWVYGCYVYDKQNYCIRDFNYEYKAVIPETVGQWVTTDKNGKDVFVGDNVNMHYFFEDFDRTTLGAFENETMVEVTIVQKELGFGFEVLDGSVSDYLSAYLQEPSEELEVIGNKWESEVTENE